MRLPVVELEDGQGFDDVLPAVRGALDAPRELREKATCRPGCAACCRHLVPISPAEARRLRAVIGGLPEGEQVAVRLAFDRLRRRLKSAGLWELLADLHAAPPDGRSWLAAAYQDERLDCPLLDRAGRCRVYAERPLACRLQLVESDPANCETGVGIKPLRPPGPPRVRVLCDLEGAADWQPLACLFK